MSPRVKRNWWLRCCLLAGIFQSPAASVLAAAGLMLPFSAVAYADSLYVRTAQGLVHGKTVNAGKVRAFLGLPYAAPPVGAMRWRAPAPPTKWQGKREATTFGARCAQIHFFDDMIFQDEGPSEDCLFLNVYAPANVTNASKLPVMFWIHGGGYLGGSSSEPRHNGDFLPLKGVVLVTINYRLGVFGFLATSDLAMESGGSAGNYGLMDMVAALHWVSENIKNFGGNPANVTIFGESAGSMAVSTLMTSPAAKTLFSKAIGESGSVFADVIPLDSLDTRLKRDDQWIAMLGVKSLAELRAMPADKILDAAKGKQGGFSRVIDGTLVTEPASQSYEAGEQAHIPLLAGWNKDEVSDIANGMTVATFKQIADKEFRDRAPDFLKLYTAATDEEAAQSASEYFSDRFLGLSTWQWLEAQRRSGSSSVYRYHFELAALPSKFHPGTFAFHSDDIEYVFGTLDTRPGWTVRPEDRKLSEQMMGYWTNFAKTGNPNGAGLPPWPKYDKDDSLIHLDSEITSGPDTLRRRYEFLLQK